MQKKKLMNRIMDTAMLRLSPSMPKSRAMGEAKIYASAATNGDGQGQQLDALPAFPDALRLAGAQILPGEGGHAVVESQNWHENVIFHSVAHGEGGHEILAEIIHQPLHEHAAEGHHALLQHGGDAQLQTHRALLPVEHHSPGLKRNTG
jgi:hypothetical protein